MEWLRWLLRDESAQSSVIGIVLILGLTLAAASAVVAFGTVALDDGKHESRIGQAEQAMTQFDSRTAQVALGDSNEQTIRMGQSDGSYRVEESAGHVTLFHEDWNESEADPPDETIYEATLGAVVYESGGTSIAYQGGGVWRKDEGGGSSMISPPELHNRDATLTFPIITIVGEGAGGGRQQLHVSPLEQSTPIYPDMNGDTTSIDDQYVEDEDVLYRNPVTAGNMTVEIDSDYCEAWRSFFLSRTDGRVDDCDDGVVTAQIVALGAQGHFDIAGEGELSVRGVEELHELTLRMEESRRGSSSFNRLDWVMEEDRNDEVFRVKFESLSPAKCDESVKGSIHYENESVTQTWTNESAFTLDSNNCDDDLFLEVDLLDSTILMDAQADPVTIDGTEYNATHPPTLEDLTRHYFDTMGDMDMEIVEENQAIISDTSSGNIEYKGSGQVVTFLHVTENKVKVTIN